VAPPRRIGDRHGARSGQRDRWLSSSVA
jgi:hypothetical protein